MWTVAQILLPSQFSPFSSCAGVVWTQSKCTQRWEICSSKKQIVLYFQRPESLLCYKFSRQGYTERTICFIQLTVVLAIGLHGQNATKNVDLATRRENAHVITLSQASAGRIVQALDILWKLQLVWSRNVPVNKIKPLLMGTCCSTHLFLPRKFQLHRSILHLPILCFISLEKLKNLDINFCYIFRVLKVFLTFWWSESWVSYKRFVKPGFH